MRTLRLALKTKPIEAGLDSLAGAVTTGGADGSVSSGRCTREPSLDISSMRTLERTGRADTLGAVRPDTGRRDRLGARSCSCRLRISTEVAPDAALASSFWFTVTCSESKSVLLSIGIQTFIQMRPKKMCKRIHTDFCSSSWLGWFGRSLDLGALQNDFNNEINEK
jgi:hypothetical protein